MKKSVVIGIIIVIIVVISIFLLTRPTLLGNINRSYKEQTTLNSSFSFSADAGGRIKFSLRSNVESGNLDIILYDSQGNVVYKLAKAKALETFFTLDHSDSYTLAAECSNFTGNFKIKVFEAN